MLAAADFSAGETTIVGAAPIASPTSAKGKRSFMAGRHSPRTLRRLARHLPESLVGFVHDLHAQGLELVADTVRLAKILLEPPTCTLCDQLLDSGPVGVIS